MSKIFLIDSKSHQFFEIAGDALIGSSCPVTLGMEADGPLAPEHFRISHKNDNFFVEAVSNAHAVQLNGIKLLAGQKYLVRKSDSLVIGPKEFVFSMTDELPEKTVTKIRSDIFGITDPDLEFGDLKLEVDVEDNRSPVEMMKKSRKIILEIQDTKKQVSQKIQEMHAFSKEVESISEELKTIENELSDHHFQDEKVFFETKDKLKDEERSLRAEIESLEKRLNELKEKHHSVQNECQFSERVEGLVLRKQEAYQKKVEANHKYETLRNIGLEEKLKQLNQCLRDEQDNYQRMHEVSSTYLQGRKKRYG